MKPEIKICLDRMDLYMRLAKSSKDEDEIKGYLSSVIYFSEELTLLLKGVENENN